MHEISAAVVPFLETWAPVIVLAATAVGMVACAQLFFTLKRQIQKLKKECRDLRQVQEDASKEFTSRNAALEERLRAEEQRASVLTPPAPPRSGLNMNKRTHVIRLARRGERPGAIASTLQLPRAEVDLLLKLEKISQEPHENRESLAG